VRVVMEEEDGVRVRRRKESERRRGTSQGQSVWGPLFFRLANEKGNKAESGPSDKCYARCAKAPVSRQKREKASQAKIAMLGLARWRQ
jgi:hypothetical protein